MIKFSSLIRKIFKIFKINPVNLWAPYDYVQSLCEFEIHKYLNVDRKEIGSWCIVGGYLGKEIPVIRRSYPCSSITVFECSHRYFDRLRNKYSSFLNVDIVKKAVSSISGKSIFFETSLKGSGSLLELGELAKKSYGAKKAESFEVETITLDDYFKGNDSLDILQIDVQGAEIQVLQGAVQLLKRTKSILIEVSINPNLYNNSVTFAEIFNFLSIHDFELIQLGTDFNFTGNALFVKKSVNIVSII